MPVTNLLLAARALVGADPMYLNGDVGELTINQDGRLRVSSKPGFFDPTTGNLVTVGQQVAVDVTDASNVMVHVKNTGTAAMSAGVLTFEGSVDSTDGVNGTWFGLQAARSNANTVELASPALSLAVGAGYGNAWELSINAVRWFRVRLSTAVTTNSIATVTVIRGTYATEPVPVIQTHAVTGSGTFTTTPQTGGSQYSLTTAATTNAALIKSSAGCLYELSIANPTATAAYVKLYNKATAPVPGTDIPILTIAIPAGAEKILEFGALGKRFATGLGIAVTAAAAATDTGVTVAGIQIHGTYI